MTGPVIPRPFVKWAGGKAQILNDLLRLLPPDFGCYHEPFVGGGALFFRLQRDDRLRGAFLSDLNAELIDAYRAIRDNVESLITLLSTYPYDRGFYYNLRAQDAGALDPVARAARLIYLNRTSYNGLYRVNRRGQFNVPFGRYRSPTICDAENLRAVSAALRGVEVDCLPFEAVLQRAVPGDLVYFDPPYAPLSPTAHFTAYQPGGFGAGDQARLRDVCLELERRGTWVLLSNSDATSIRALYASPPFRVHTVRARRAINSDYAGRGALTELLVTTYPAPSGPATAKA